MITLAEVIFKKAHEIPDDIALTLFDQHISYKKLTETIDQLRVQCAAIKINQQATVVLILPNITETVTLFYACNALGARVVFIHPLTNFKQIIHQLEVVSATHVFYLDILSKRYPIKDNSAWYKVNIANSYKGIMHWFLKAKTFTNKEPTLPNTQNQNPFSTFIYQKDAVILFSSGTSNQQKAIALSNEAFNALASQMETCIQPTPHVDSMFCVLPFFHGFGLGITLHAVLSLGGRAILVPRISKNTVVKTLLKQKPTYIAGVPFLFRIMLEDKRLQKADCSFIKQAFVGGEFIPSAFVDQVNSFLSKNGSKATLQVGYGTTETLTAVTLMPVNTNIPYAVGYPLIGNSIKILKEDLTIASPYQHGEILINGPTLMNGYLNENNEHVFIRIDGKKYYRSHDIGYLDKDGLLYFGSRKDDLIKVRGFYVNPTEIEQNLFQHQNIKEAKVFLDQNNDLCAMMVLHHPAKINNLKKETSQLLSGLSDWSLPKRYLVVSFIPKNLMNKMNRQSIMDALVHQEIEFLQEWFL